MPGQWLQDARDMGLTPAEIRAAEDGVYYSLDHFTKHTDEESWSRGAFFVAQTWRAIPNLIRKPKSQVRKLTEGVWEDHYEPYCDWEQFWDAFVTAARKVRTPRRHYDEQRLRAAMEHYAKNPPEWIIELSKRLYRGSERMTLTMACCFALHEAMDGQTWFLPTATLAEIAGVSDWKAPAMWLRNLREDGIIATIEKHTTNRSPRYQWIMHPPKEKKKRQ